MMTFHDVFEQLADIDSAAVSILKAAGFYSDKGLEASVRPLSDPAQDLFLLGQTETLLQFLQIFHKHFRYLSSPVCGEYRLEPLPNGHYGFYDKNGKAHSLSDGSTIEAKIHDRYGRQYWVKSWIKHDGNGCHLWEHPDIPLDGLTVREREVAL